MQYPKDAVRKSLIDEALKEFLRYGYKGASIRSIVKHSNTSIGNFYKYFSSKDDLFEIVIGSVYHRLLNYIGKFDEVEFNERTEDIFFGLMDKIVEICKDNSVELTVLLNCSQGSKYESCKNIFVDKITEIVARTVNYNLSKEGRRLRDNFIIYLISYNLVESIAIILREKEDKLEIRQLILEIINVFYKDITEKLNTESV